MGVVIDLSIGNSTTTIGFSFVEQNYNDLSAISGTAIGQLAYVVNSQGTAWLPGTIGGDYYPKGIYVWDGVNWVSDRNAIATQLQIDTDDINQLETDLSNEITNRINADINLQNQIDTKLDDVIAGTNITIDKTNPLEPIISSTGGGVSRNIKAGKVLKSAFSGNPKKTSAIMFTTPFPSADYSLVLTAHTQNNTTFSIDYESRTASSFVINTHANNVNNLIDVTWIATTFGE